MKNFSDDIKMEFDLDNCVKATFQKGKLVTSEHVEINYDTKIKALDQHKTYKYLGI